MKRYLKFQVIRAESNEYRNEGRIIFWTDKIVDVIRYSLRMIHAKNLGCLL